TQVQRLDVVRHVTMTAGGSEMSPRATPTEEPDGGNLLVRIWRGAGVGNLPAYSTTAFSTDCARPPCRPPCATGYHHQAREHPRGSLGLAGRPQARHEELRAKAAKTSAKVWECPLPLSPLRRLVQTSATVAMERLQPSGTRGDAVEGRLLGETLGHRRGQRAR